MMRALVTHKASGTWTEVGCRAGAADRQTARVRIPTIYTAAAASDSGRRPPPGWRRLAVGLLPQHHAHPVGGAIVHEGDGGGIYRSTVQLGLRDDPATVLRVG